MARFVVDCVEDSLQFSRVNGNHVVTLLCDKVPSGYRSDVHTMVVQFFRATIWAVVSTVIYPLLAAAKVCGCVRADIYFSDHIVILIIKLD